MPAPVVPILLGASALGLGLWWLWPAEKTGVAPLVKDKTGEGKKPPTAEQTAAAKVKGAADGCARGTADAKAGKTPDQASADLNTGGKDHGALVAAEDASGDGDAYFAAYAVAHKACFDATKASMTKAMPLPTKYVVTASDTPATVAGRFGISVDRLLVEFNGYGHGESGVKDYAPYPYGADLFSFTSTFPGMGSGVFPPAGTSFSPTFQAGHKATANLRPIFRSNHPGAGGQWYWWFPTGAGPDKVPMPYSPNDSGFGRIYSDGGLFLVGPWYAGMTLNAPGTSSDAGTGAMVLRRSQRGDYATGPRVGNLALVGARRAPVDVDHMHAGMRDHFRPAGSRRHGWPAPPDEIDDGDSTLYRSY